MKKFFAHIHSAIQSISAHALSLCQAISARIEAAVFTAKVKMADCTGDLATNTIGAIIVAVVMVGILVSAVNTFFPTFFSGMFADMKTKLSKNWT